MSEYRFNNAIVPKSVLEEALRMSRKLPAKDFSLVVNRPSVKLYTKNDKILTFQAFMKFDFDYELIYRLACDLSVRSKWDQGYLSEKIVEKVCVDDESVSCDVIYTVLKTPMGLKTRDSLLFRVVFKLKDCYVVYMTSCDHKDYPVNPKYIRTKTYFHCYVISKDGNGKTKLYLWSKHDLEVGILVPKFIVNMVAKTKPIEWSRELKQAARRAKVVNDKIVFEPQSRL